MATIYGRNKLYEMIVYSDEPIVLHSRKNEACGKGYKKTPKWYQTLGHASCVKHGVHIGTKKAYVTKHNPPELRPKRKAVRKNKKK